MFNDWRLTVDGYSIDSRELTQAQWEMVYTLVTQLGSSVAGLPPVVHAEAEIDPLHCPSCRSAIALTALVSDGQLMTDAVLRVAGMGVKELLAGVEIIEPDAPAAVGDKGVMPAVVD